MALALGAGDGSLDDKLNIYTMPRLLIVESARRYPHPSFVRSRCCDGLVPGGSAAPLIPNAAPASPANPP